MSKGIYADIEKFKRISIHRDMLDELRDKYDLSTKGDSLLFFYGRKNILKKNSMTGWRFTI